MNYFTQEDNNKIESCPVGFVIVVVLRSYYKIEKIQYLI